LNPDDTVCKTGPCPDRLPQVRRSEVVYLHWVDADP